ncbi:MAG TPA: ABC transporter substrate-binding protein [Terriglobales bacterium]|nr:ABC transporter substrate-binding protein [Terriglobales bacterium]
MRRTAWPLLVISSVVALAVAGAAAVRPRYGGTLRIMLRVAPGSLDPAKLSASQGAHISPFMFEGLTRFDTQGLQPGLATRWQGDSSNRRWQFWLRPGVKFHDGTPLTAEAVAASLRAANPTWAASADGDSVIIETTAPDVELPAELALPRNGIARHAGNKVVGTGAFAVSDWQPGRSISLTANEDYWGGRPFVDSVLVTLGQNWRQQMVALELGKAEVVEAAPEQARRLTSAGRTITESAPNELVALVFTREAQSADETRVRQALSAAIDRASIVNVLLQGQGEAAETILPNWMTGYAMLFAQTDEKAKNATAPSSADTLTLSYEASDPANQLIAERVALNARDAGIRVQTAASAANADVRLVGIPLASLQPQLALQVAAGATGLPIPQLQGTSPEELYGREKEMLQSGRIIPLAHVPEATAIGPGVNGWHADLAGGWQLTDVWLGSAP